MLLLPAVSCRCRHPAVAVGLSRKFEQGPFCPLNIEPKKPLHIPRMTDVIMMSLQEADMTARELTRTRGEYQRHRVAKVQVKGARPPQPHTCRHVSGPLGTYDTCRYSALQCKPI